MFVSARTVFTIAWIAGKLAIFRHNIDNHPALAFPCDSQHYRLLIFPKYFSHGV